MKMYRSLLALTVTAGLLAATTACTKEGLDGDATIHGGVEHHGAHIPNASVYVKFGAKEYPGSLVSEYDMSVAADTGGHFEITELKKGDYYLFGIGFDSSISAVVSGGVHVKLEKGAELTQDIAVTE